MNRVIPKETDHPGRGEPHEPRRSVAVSAGHRSMRIDVSLRWERIPALDGRNGLTGRAGGSSRESRREVPHPAGRPQLLHPLVLPLLA